MIKQKMNEIGLILCEEIGELAFSDMSEPILSFVSTNKYSLHDFFELKKIYLKNQSTNEHSRKGFSLLFHYDISSFEYWKEQEESSNKINYVGRIWVKIRDEKYFLDNNNFEEIQRDFLSLKNRIEAILNK